MPIDILIVGQGLAGSLLAWECLRQELTVMVIDPGDVNASKVAAGLVNPVTGQRLVKSAGLDYLLPAALLVYEMLSEEFKQSFFIPMEMLRIIKNSREQQLAQKRLSQPDYQNFISEVGEVAFPICHEHGILQKRQTGFLKTILLLDKIREYLITRGSYRQVRLNYADIVLHPDLQWQGMQPRHIVFCEGHHASQNPWFGGLPFQLAKGEILTCQTPTPCPNQILNFGYWLIPQTAQIFRVGATFDANVNDLQPTPAAKNQLLNTLGQYCPSLKPLDVLARQVGIRPTTLDKQPFVGAHPHYQQLHIFNGFGAKGSLMIPWYAQQFVLALKQQAVLPINSHVQRYYETHFAH